MIKEWQFNTGKCRISDKNLKLTRDHMKLNKYFANFVSARRRGRQRDCILRQLWHLRAPSLLRHPCNPRGRLALSAVCTGHVSQDDALCVLSQYRRSHEEYRVSWFLMSLCYSLLRHPCNPRGMCPKRRPVCFVPIRAELWRVQRGCTLY